MLIKIKKLHPAAVLPKAASKGAAGLDLSACLNEEAVLIPPFGRFLVPTGIAVEVPAGHVGLVAIRSSMGIKNGVTLANGIGVIDSDYRGEIMVGLLNQTNEAYTLQNGQRIAQLIVTPAPTCTVEEVGELSATARGSGGFGSTGK